MAPTAGPLRHFGGTVKSLPLLFIAFSLSLFAQSNNTPDPNYKLLRDAPIAESFDVEGVVLRRDAATIELRDGVISFTGPVLGKVTGAVFAGSGTFTLKPANPLEQRYVQFRAGEATLADSFDEMLLLFTDDTYQELKKSGAKPVPAGSAASLLNDWRKKLRRNPASTRSLAESVLSGEDIDNAEAEILADLYVPASPGMFNAYFGGKKYKSSRYWVRPRGVSPSLSGGDQVAFLNVAPGADRDGILYLSYLGGSLAPPARKPVIDVTHYAIDTNVAKNRRLSATSTISFLAQQEGARVLRFGLLPRLRVSRVSLVDGPSASFIQEPFDDDSAFYVVLGEGLRAGKEYKVTVAYAGDGVISNEGGGNFSVGARTSWYPSAGAFSDYATFDLTFHTPKEYTLVSIGKPVSSARDGDFNVTRWTTNVPVAVAGFNYGQFKTKQLTDESTAYVIEGHAAPEVPSYIRSLPNSSNLTPSAMLDKALSEAQASVRVFTHFFGPSPYGRIAVTQQAEFSFGQSWPSLVYLPVISFLDGTQRYMLLNTLSSSLNAFIQEVTAHEVAHQWWGHIVGWSSYRDQWLSEGFADFSAGLYLQATRKNDTDYRNYLKRWNKDLLEANAFGIKPNDAGPIVTGFRLSSERTQGAYSTVVYNKGGYVLHMLRSLMHTAQTGDQAFIAMMKDFVGTYSGKTASTQDFKRIVEKYIQPHMDLDQNGTMDWFFNDWVYGTEVPRYKLTYSLTPQANGAAELTFKVTQSNVSPEFRMPVRIYMVLQDRVAPLGRMNLFGSSTSEEVKVKLPVQPKEITLNYNYDVLALEGSTERTK